MDVNWPCSLTLLLVIGLRDVYIFFPVCEAKPNAY